jgi:membrane protease YdiL (CAAX protease family)
MADHAPPRTALAWCVIGAVVGGILLLHLLRPDPAGEAFALDLMTQQVRIQYGTRDFAGPAGDAATYDAIRAAFARGPVAQRQRFAVVAGDLRGAKAARDVLDETERVLRERNVPLAGREKEVQGILRKIHGEPPVPLDDGERAVLRASLGWFGDLALAPVGAAGREAVLAPARRSAIRYFAIAAGVLAALGIGVVVAAAFWISVLRREGTVFLLGPGTAPHGIYAETFAAYLVLFLLLSFAAGLVLDAAGLRDHVLAVDGVLVLLSLGALAWPVWRGVPFATVRDDLGLRMPAHPLREVLAGVVAWLSSLPIMAAAIALVVGLMAALGRFTGPADPLAPPNLPNHPIMAEIARGDRWLLVLLVAAGAAPLVEEVFFRGALYRHLREATGGRGRLPSVAIAAGISGLVFAAIHPQGLVAIPMLMAVAWAMVQAREWRGSLLAPVAAHSLNNAAVTLLAWLQFG